VKENKIKIQQLIQKGQYSSALKKLNALDNDVVWKNSLILHSLRLSNQREKAVKLAEKIYSSKQQDTNTLYHVALIFSENNKVDDALKVLKGLIIKHPDNSELKKSYATILSANNELDLAQETFREVLKLNPSDAVAYSQLGRILCRTGRVEEGLQNFQSASRLNPNDPKYLQRLAYWSNYSDKKTTQANSLLAKLWATRAFPNSDQGSDSWRFANPNKPLKIGFLSSDFCKHAISFFITPLLKHINRDGFKVIAYSNVKKPDEVTDAIKKHCDVWNDIANLSDENLSAQIGADQLDVLIDLNGHTANNRLAVFSQHIVPIQINWLGYPATTGLKSMHYRITDNIADPDKEQDKYYTEELIRLPNSFLCYEPHSKSPSIKKTKKTGSIRFGSFNNLAKISSKTIDAWAGVLDAIPNSTLYIKRQQLINKSVKQHLIKEFQQRGIDSDRLILKTSKAKIEQHLAEYNKIDIALDTTPYNGTTTTLEALWMGTPVLTLTGETHASRVSASILSQLDLPELVSDSVDEFIEKAVKLNNNKALASFSKEIREKMKKSNF